MEGKRAPIIRLFVDMELGQSVGCARNCLTHLKEFGYEFKRTEKQKELVYEIKGHRRDEEPGNADDSQFKPSTNAWDRPQKAGTGARTPLKRL